MTTRDLLDKCAQSMEYVAEGLSWTRKWEENNKIDRMPFGERHADFGITLEASNARSVTCTRVDDNDRRCARSYKLLQVVRTTARNTEQRIVCRTPKRSGIEQHLGFEVQQRWETRFFVGEHIVSPPPQNIDEENPALRQIH